MRENYNLLKINPLYLCLKLIGNVTAIALVVISYCYLHILKNTVLLVGFIHKKTAGIYYVEKVKNPYGSHNALTMPVRYPTGFV